MGGLRLHGGLARQGDKTTSVERSKKKHICAKHLGPHRSPGDGVGQFMDSRVCTDVPQTHGRYWRSGDYISGKLWSQRAGDRGTKAQR